MSRWKNLREICLEYKWFLTLLLFLDILMAFFMWLMDAKAFRAVVSFFTIAVLLLFALLVIWMVHRERLREQNFLEFLASPDETKEQQLLKGLSPREQRGFRQLYDRLQNCEQAFQQEQQKREEYEEYIESWAHEIKVPLSLMELLLDNRREEMSSLLFQRMLYAKSQIQEQITQILYYARLKASHRDYLFETVNLRECCREIVAQWEPLLQEEGIHVVWDMEEISVFTDRKGVSFIVEQALSNACKYKDKSKENRQICIKADRDVAGGTVCLCIEDNGIGVKEGDLSFLFDKGFTGETDLQRRKATGMGLYLVGKMAENLSLQVRAESEYKKGFTLFLEFPVVEEKGGDTK